MTNGAVNFPLTLDNGIIKNDHAVSSVLPEIKAYWPKAAILPILIGQKFPVVKLDSLIAELNRLCSFDCLLIASVDFSHYLPATLAEVHDAHTLKLLTNLDFNQLATAEVDSPQSLYLLTKFSQSKSAHKFNLFAHTNSGFISNNPDIETTTHVFASYSNGFSSKDFSHTTTSTPQSFDPLKSQSTLGTRFFYGVDEFTLDPSLNFAVSTITTPTQTIKSFLPLDHNSFVRGSEKQLLIKKYFDSIPDSQHLIKDYFWGKLTYDQNPNSPPSPRP